MSAIKPVNEPVFDAVAGQVWIDEEPEFIGRPAPSACAIHELETIGVPQRHDGDIEAYQIRRLPSMTEGPCLKNAIGWAKDTDVVFAGAEYLFIQLLMTPEAAV